MHPTEILSTEHRAVLVALQVMEKACESLASGHDSAAMDLDQLLDFFRNFVDTCHHGKEEQILFPELERRGVPREGGPVGVMLSEHELGREHIQALRASLDAARAGDRSAAARMLQLASAYRGLLEAHIRKEDNVLFPMAARLLEPSDAESMAAAFDRLEREHIGEGRHEAYHETLRILHTRYLA